MNIFFGAGFALVKMSITHLLMLVKIRKRQLFLTLETLLHLIALYV
jgi:hypothetical protein